MASPHLVEQVGRVLDGRYRVIAPIGTGASAAVFLADDTTLRRRVALKALHAALATDQGFLRRFEQEAHTAAALSHPNVMRVLDWGENSDGPFLVLEYLGGGSLRALLDHGTSLTPEQAVQIGIQAARALDYAHRRGLVHRDIKPGNLLFDDEGRLAIADFGLARALAEAAWTEPGGAMLGTARYASPEQVRGLSLDGKADVYALGLVLYEAVAGKVPFTADTTIATLMARLDAHVTVPEDFGPLGPVIEKATQSDPDARPTAGEMAMALEAAAAKLPTAGRLTLPGAIPLDLDQLSDQDPTNLPGVAEPVTSVSVEAQPLPPETKPQRKLLPWRKSEPAVEGPVFTAEGKALAAQKKKRWRPTWKQGVIAAIVAVILAATAGGAYATYYFTGGQRIVPALAGVTYEQAEAAAEQAGVRLINDGEKFSEDIPAGQTFAQSPATGTEIYRGQAAHISISKGPAPRQLSSAIGQQIDQVRPRLEEQGFKVAITNRNDESAPPGRILEQTPRDGTQAKGSEVRFVVSGGPAPRVVRDVKGRSERDAVAQLNAQQLKVTVRQDFSNNVPSGQVASTSPSAGASVERNSTVTVVISKGPNLVAVPDVRGQTVAAAQSALTAAGFVAQDVRGRLERPVFDTDPAIGTKIPRGASVSLYTR